MTIIATKRNFPWRSWLLGESEKSMMDHRATLPLLLTMALLLACAVCGGQEVTFEDVTDALGVSYQQKDEEVFEFQEPMTGGAAAGDYDGDGWEDLFVTRHDDPPILFKNEDGLTFADVTDSAGLSAAQPTGSNGAAGASRPVSPTSTAMAGPTSRSRRTGRRV